MNMQIFKHEFWGNNVLQYCLFVVIILLGQLLKRIISSFFSRLLFKAIQKFADDVRVETFVALLLKPIEFFLSLCTFYLAINQLKHPLEVVIWHYIKIADKIKVKEGFTFGELIDKAFFFLIILSVFWIILRIIDFIAFVWMHRASKSGSKADEQLIPFLKELLKIIVAFVGFFALLGYVFEVNAVSLITGLGIGGIAIAMAAKESLENLIGSFTIFMDKPFAVGDLVKVNGVEGTVEKVGFRSTVICSVDKTTLVIPNRAMIAGVLENLTRRNFRRVNFRAAIVLETPAKSIQAIINELRSYLESAVCVSEPLVFFDSFGDSSINLQIYCLIENTTYSNFLKTKEEINFKVKEVIEKHDSHFAYPTQRSYTLPPTVEEPNND